VPLAAHLATDCRFTFDGVDITDDKAVAESQSEHRIGAIARLQKPEQYRAGVLCQLLMLGVNRDGVVVNCGYTNKVIIPDGDGRVSIEDKLRIPRGRGEYELRLEIFEDEEQSFPVGRVPLIVTRTDGPAG
jgi:hypothetical protein